MKVVKKNCNSIFFVFSALVSTQIVLAQTKPQHAKPNWNDTTFIPMALADTLRDSKIIVFSVGLKAIIYVPLNAVRALAEGRLVNEFTHDKSKRILDYLDSAALSSDSIFLYDLYDFDWYISKQMLGGNARVYYKKNKIYVDTIFHRQERYGSMASRFFYLPDKRPFFSVLEFSGILDNDGNEGFFSGRYYKEYIEEGKKLASLRKE